MRESEADLEIEIRALAARDSLVTLTALQNRAYAPLAARGLNMTAATQRVEDTRQRNLAGQTFLAVYGGEMVGSITVSTPAEVVPGTLADCLPLFKKPEVSRFFQFAIDPDWCGHSIGPRLIRQAEEWALARGFRAMAVDTPLESGELLDFYRHMGYRVVGEIRYPGKTYVSAVLRKDLDHSPLRAPLMTMARYHAWAMGRLLDAVATLDDARYRQPNRLRSGNLHGTLNHLLVVEREIWWRRIVDGASPIITADVELVADRADLDRQLRAASSQWEAVVEGWTHDRLHGQLRYLRRDGEPEMLSMAEALLHVFNHATHHRGQITAELAELGRAPPYVDLIRMLQDEAEARAPELAGERRRSRLERLQSDQGEGAQ